MEKARVHATQNTKERSMKTKIERTAFFMLLILISVICGVTENQVDSRWFAFVMGALEKAPLILLGYMVCLWDFEDFREEKG